MPPVVLIDPATGKPGVFDDPKAVDAAISAGWRPEAAAEAAARSGAAQISEDYGGINDAVTAFVRSGAGAASLGLTDLIGRAGRDANQVAEDRRIREANPLATTLGGVGGAVIPGLLSGGAGTAGALARLTPAGAASRLGSLLSRTAPEAGAFAKATRGAAGALAEGTLQEAGSIASDLALADDDAAVERIMGQVGSRLLTTGSVSALGGAALGTLEHGLASAGRRMRAATKADEAAAVGPIPDDLAGLDRKQLVKLRDDELARVEAELVPQRAQLADEINAFREASKDANSAVGEPWVAVATGSDAERLAAASLAKRTAKGVKKAEAAAVEAEQAAAKRAAQEDAANAAADAMGAKRAPPSAALADLRARAAVKRADADAALEAASAAATAAEDANRAYPRWFEERGKVYIEADQYLDRVLRNPIALAENPSLAKKALQQQQSAMEDIAKRADEIKAFYAMDKTGRRAAALEKIPAALEANRALQQKIDALAVPNSPRLASLKNAVDSYEAPKMTTRQKIGGALAFGAVMGATGGIDLPGMGSIAPVLGAAAGSAVAAKLGGQIARASIAAKERTAKAVDLLMSGTRTARKLTPPLASQVLAAVRFAPESDEDRKRPSSPTLQDSFEARSSEMARIMVPGPDGKATVRPHVRAQIAANLRPIAASAPHLADRMETSQVKKLEFYESKRPRPIQIGMATIQPTEMAQRAWARIIAAGEDPAGIEERLASGVFSPEDAEVMRELYPARMAEIVQMVVERMEDMRKLPHQNRLALSLFTGAAVDPAMEPRILAQLQNIHKTEPGTEGGTMAPRPKPAFGSVTRPEGTPAQQRAG